MPDTLQKIKETSIGATKLKTVIEWLSNSIAHEDFKVGDVLPSVNELSKKLSLSRDTVFKAYRELKVRGTISSTPAKGYYISDTVSKVFLLLDSYSPYKDILYNSFKENLPSGCQVDLAFHHYNYSVFETLVNNSIGKYSTYVVMNFNNKRIADVLRKIDSKKLLILDWGRYKDENYSHVCQDFEEAIYNCLTKHSGLFAKYKKLNVYSPVGSEHPLESFSYIRKFCEKIKISYSAISSLSLDEMNENEIYFVFRPKELSEVVKMVRIKGFELGVQTGILAYNDTPLYEIIDKGITSISTDFMQMGREAARFVGSKKKISMIIPTRMIIRGSL
jgi:DNA-binding Lrp family transcriptional regulator